MMRGEIMSREIKFRAWDKYHQHMLDDFYFQNIDDSNWVNVGFERLKDLKDLVIMQFTGLLDKNGKEIYEGDVVANVIYFDEPRKLEFNVLGAVSTVFKGSQFSITTHMLRDIEVIGNIYSNPELVKP